MFLFFYSSLQQYIVKMICKCIHQKIMSEYRTYPAFDLHVLHSHKKFLYGQ